MRVLVVVMTALAAAAFGPPAMSAYAPVEPPAKASAIAAELLGLATDRGGGERERAYFSAPQPIERDGLSCRMPLSLFDKTRLAQACH